MLSFQDINSLMKILRIPFLRISFTRQPVSVRRQGTIDKMSAAAFFLLSGMGLLYSVFLRANYFSPGSSPSDIKDYYLLLNGNPYSYKIRERSSSLLHPRSDYPVSFGRNWKKPTLRVPSTPQLLFRPCGITWYLKGEGYFYFWYLQTLLPS